MIDPKKSPVTLIITILVALLLALIWRGLSAGQKLIAPAEPTPALTYNAAGYVLGQTETTMPMRYVTQLVTFASDSTVEIQLNKDPSSSQARMAPSTEDKIYVVGPYTWEYDDATAVLTVTALYESDSALTMLMLIVQ